MQLARYMSLGTKHKKWGKPERALPSETALWTRVYVCLFACGRLLKALLEHI